MQIRWENYSLFLADMGLDIVMKNAPLISILFENGITALLAQ